MKIKVHDGAVLITHGRRFGVLVRKIDPAMMARERDENTTFARDFEMLVAATSVLKLKKWLVVASQSSHRWDD
jgi:hypothetical protein